MQATTERMKREYLSRPRAQVTLDILAAKDRSPRRIGNVAKLDCILFTPKTVGSRQVNNTGAGECRYKQI